jgi:hypothetical protein
MALKGNLRDFSVTQLLNLINIAKKTGTLYLQCPSTQVQVSFREGKLAYAQAGQEDNSLVAILYKAQKISPAQYRILKEKAVDISDKELGLMLINANYLSQQDIISSIQAYFLQLVNHLFSWAEGLFNFEVGRLPPEDKIPVRINLENIIIEGARRMRERELLEDEIPSLEMSLKFADRPGTNIRNVNLSVEEWRVVSFINPKNTIQQVAAAAKLNDLEIRRIVYSLLQAGLVEIVRPLKPPPAPPIKRFPPEVSTKAEQKSLIHRLISRIRSL